jgi:K(+)-stimulated pyrophosphate-energized sodium pump
MSLPLLIGGVCIVTSIIGTYFVGWAAQQHHGRNVQGLPGHRVLSIPAIWLGDPQRGGRFRNADRQQRLTGGRCSIARCWGWRSRA